MTQYLEKDWVMEELTACFESDFKTFTYSSLHPVMTQELLAEFTLGKGMHLQTNPSTYPTIIT